MNEALERAQDSASPHAIGSQKGIPTKSVAQAKPSNANSRIIEGPASVFVFAFLNQQFHPIMDRNRQTDPP